MTRNEIIRPIGKIKKKETVTSEIKVTSGKAKNKRKPRVSDGDFKIPSYGDYGYLYENNLKVAQLKKIAKAYKLRVSGKKQDLIDRILYFLKSENNVRKIQKCWKDHVFREIRRMRGCALFNRKKCVNAMDFLTLNDVQDIPVEQFITYCDKKGICYGFNLKSLSNSFSSNNSKVLMINPFTQEKMDPFFLEKVTKIIKFCSFIDIKLDLNMKNNLEHLSKERKMELKIVSLFQKIDQFGYVTDPNWFFHLNISKLKKFYEQSIEIWYYRSQTNLRTKRKICAPHGNPFKNIGGKNISEKSFSELRLDASKIMDGMLNHAVNKDSQSLGVIYILSVFTSVSTKAAQAFPWLSNSTMSS